MAWNHWPGSNGIGGRDRVELVAEITWNQWPGSYGIRNVQYINRTYKRSGTLWEGRFRSCIIQQENYLLACQRYIELNPVRAAMVGHPGEYRWSSYQTNAQGEISKVIRPHRIYCQLEQD